MDRRTKIAVWFTAVYLVGVAVLIGFKAPEFFGMPLNSLGDFLAGAFGPLALAWLVFGYFQQGDELRQGTEALNVQGEELKNSVEQQRQLADISLQALELSRKEREEETVKYRHGLRPILHLEGLQMEFVDGRWIATCRLFNDGAQIYSLSVAFQKGANKHYCASFRTLNRGESLDFKCMWHIDSPGEDILIDVFYKERDSVEDYCRFVPDSDIDPGGISFVRNEKSSI
ncbi:hypothetical protein [Pseudomonas sp. Xaverov 259]|uniref:hypothetical protein n=1 Tax=Pseudomonas sp. Xaverov 259 TaxID=2666086 RepID=UPI001C5B755C|nr:hypothetical protein [Pseudomonas sp. Xaverov 259]